MTSGSEAQPCPYRPRVVLAEDDDDFRNLLKSWLEVDGYRVTGVSSGTALLEQLQTALAEADPPALVISDDRMPGMRGLRALRQARASGLTLPLVLITAFGTDDVVAEAASVSVKVVPKPFDIDDLRTLAGWLAPTRVFFHDDGQDVAKHPNPGHADVTLMNWLLGVPNARTSETRFREPCVRAARSRRS